ncbi:MAG: hypothetical protein HXX16_18245 [Bacteroidales bacterium]|nr:hypothetical protein [Bacteroidales bacterium]
MGWIGKTIDFIWNSFLTIIGILLATAIWAIGLFVEIAADIINWLKKRQGASKTGGIADGEEFKNFINEKKRQGQCGQISLKDLERIGKSAINFTDNETQMISGKKGLEHNLNKLLKENGGVVEIPLSN